ncbi:uncharacterized protein LOC129899009 isoform X2 [Solanum dulcamara]|uniref:uncharacterized protein LOC129899009 isoform X2 n=1 Tax=Solanum dulcamara TaxID=45834 RepID=UPI002485B2E9|nr:uncharacterized protein LOC129899009 isoform X2 [Solanum dulcamara]XP_055829724.1 uncharacterized protein LOC129899009 isoform X2 [Solanum dulcamara]XP_055829726.1 uncharacterized protein LOC129899009 isoform X2 [Solanum dulcamara]XP_055829727.1 uncharacterized protein LOC129899009 isoform X2 [Solanum dulcamara]XP_055829728.1 uncharacterized protein LOC129899009 isoform X2 [Solanum dulcamara]
MDKEQVEKFKSHLEKEHIEKLKSDMEKEDIEKFNKYEIEGRKYLMSKYFSDKTIFGGNIFDVKTTKDGKTTRVSRFPGYQSYADPANFNDGSSSAPTPNSTSETPNVRKRKHSSMKE